VRAADPGVAIDPLEAGAGLIWVSPIVPATGAAANDLLRIIDPIYRRHGFDTLVTFTLITERALCAVTNIAFDRGRADECEAAGRCYEALMDALMRSGYVPYRTGPLGTGKLERGSRVFWDVARQIKQLMDPAGIISPGRYINT
jgi:4-cresol dehydrogenase (hydroxylating)